MITRGSSNEIPSASVTCMTKLKYLSYVMNGAMASVWKLKRTRSAWGTTKMYASAAPVRNNSSPTKSEGTSAFFSRAYSAGARKAHSCQRMIGDASTSPTRNPSLRTIITGSVGLRTTSLPSVR